MKKSKVEQGKKGKPEKEKSKQGNDDIQVSAVPTWRDFKENYLNAKNIIVYSIIILIVVMIYFQYQYEKSSHDIKGDAETEENYYEILGVEQNADLATIRKQYKDLAKMWHPDKHQDCKICKDKFAQITKAYEVLSDEANRGEYEIKSGKNIFSSHPVVLTDKNYHHLVEESSNFWVILVYENRRNDNYMSTFANTWDEVALKYKNIIKFGVIDVLAQGNLLHFLPFKFPILPSIFTHLNGEGNELFQNIDEYNVNTFSEFIENSYALAVNILDQSGITNFSEKNGKVTDISTKPISIQDLDISFLILSPKNYVDIVAKDFALAYENSVKVYQNDMGYFSQGLKILKTKGDHRLFISFNHLPSVDATELTTVIKPIPVTFKVTSDMGSKLQSGFNVGKSLIVPKIYRNNYIKHCINKIIIDGEEIEEEKKENETKINLCIIEIQMLAKEKDVNNVEEDKVANQINKSFYHLVQANFEKSMSALTQPRKKKGKDSDEYNIQVNFGYTMLDNNKELKRLYEEYIKKKEIKIDESKPSKLFLIINHTNEKFLFKRFYDGKVLHEYLESIDNSDVFEDISFGFDYFGDYEIREISLLFNERKIFSLQQIFFKSLYAQMQVSHLVGYLILLLSLYLIARIGDIGQLMMYLFYALILSITVHIGWNVFDRYA